MPCTGLMQCHITDMLIGESGLALYKAAIAAAELTLDLVFVRVVWSSTFDARVSGHVVCQLGQPYRQPSTRHH